MHCFWYYRESWTLSGVLSAGRGSPGKPSRQSDPNFDLDFVEKVLIFVVPERLPTVLNQSDQNLKEQNRNQLLPKSKTCLCSQAVRLATATVPASDKTSQGRDAATTLEMREMKQVWPLTQFFFLFEKNH